MNQLIKIRIETLCKERGLMWKDVYKKLKWNKTFASLLLNGKLIPNLSQRVALAQELNVDSSVIWGSMEDKIIFTDQEAIK